MSFIGTWENVRLLCGNHDEPVEMQIHQGPHSLFYSCPCYKSTDGNRSCNNRLTLVDYEWMLNHITDKMYDMAGGELPIVGYKFKRRGVFYEVVSKEDNVVTIKMINKKAMAK